MQLQTPVPGKRWHAQQPLQFGKTVGKIILFDFERIILAHNQILEHEAKSKLRTPFEWITP